MNKNLKGAIAVGAATVLLLGGSGTLALWNASETIDAGQITSGDLDITATGTGNWYIYDSSITDLADYASETPINTTTYRIVPEDELIYVRSGVGIEAVGTELYFAFGATAGTADDDYFELGEVEISGAALEALETTGTFLPDPAGTQVYGGADVNLTTTVTLGFTVTFDADGTDAQGTPFDFEGATIDLQQVIKQ